MATNKKPRKVYGGSARHTPMMAATRDALALPLHMAVEELIQRPDFDIYNRVLKMLATLRTAGVISESIDRAAAAMWSVCDRYDRVGRIGLSDVEAGILRASAGSLDVLLARIPMEVFEAATHKINTQFSGDQGV